MVVGSLPPYGPFCLVKGAGFFVMGGGQQGKKKAWLRKRAETAKSWRQGILFAALAVQAVKIAHCVEDFSSISIELTQSSVAQFG